MNANRMTRTTAALAAGLTLGLGATQANAAIVTTTYAFTGGSGAPAESGDLDNALSASTFGINPSSGVTAGFSGTYNNAYYNAGGTATTATGAADSSRFFYFTLTAAPGNTLSLDSLGLDFGGNTTGPGSFTANLVVQSSVGGFGSANPTLTVSPQASRSISGGNTTSPTANLSARTVDVSGSEFDNLQSVTFRLEFFYTGGTDQNNYSYRFDNVAVTTTVVPEPMSAGALLATGLMTLRRRTRR